MIPSHWYYGCVDILCLLFPFLFSFQKRMPFYKSFKSLALGILCMMAVFIPWDIFFTINGIWGFNERYINGFHLVYLPVEEWLFFICIPFASVFTFESIRHFFPHQPLEKFAHAISIAYMLVALFLFFSFFGHWYTMSTTMFTFILLALHTFYLRTPYMGWFHLSWWILLVPFFASNGILTGIEFYRYPFINTTPGSVQDMMVWYNNNHNMGIRLWSVPLDDFFYGMSMILLTITVYDRHKRRLTMS